MSIYAKLPWFLTTDTHNARGCVSQTPQLHSISYMKLTPGWAVIRINFDLVQEIGPKVGDGHS